MYVWIFQTGEPLHIDSGSRPMRAISLANKLINKGHKVLIISSDFFHQEKVKRTSKFSQIKISKNLNIDLIPSPGYYKNFGLRRLLDHFLLGINLKKYLFHKNDDLPDLAFIGYPPIETSFVLTSWLKKRKVNMILDVKDDWPKTFLKIFPKLLRPLARLFLYPYFYFAKYSMRNASVISSISPSFLEWVQNFSKREIFNKNGIKRDFVAHLVREPLRKNNIPEKKINNIKGYMHFEKEKYFCFVGSISLSFNFHLVRDAADIIFSKNKNLKIIIAGGGDKFADIKKLFKNSPNVILLGPINGFEAEYLIKSSIGTIAPYHNLEHFQKSIPNKIIESLEYGKPIISTLSGEVESLINKNEIGFSFCNEPRLFANACLEMSSNKELVEIFQKNCVSLFNKKLAYDKVYEKILRKMQNLKSRK